MGGGGKPGAPGTTGGGGRPPAAAGGSGERASCAGTRCGAGAAATIGAPQTTQKRALGWLGSPHWWQSRIIKQPARASCCTVDCLAA
jgi:hypothetical protein